MALTQQFFFGANVIWHSEIEFNFHRAYEHSETQARAQKTDSPKYEYHSGKLECNKK